MKDEVLQNLQTISFTNIFVNILLGTHVHDLNGSQGLHNGEWNSLCYESLKKV